MTKGLASDTNWRYVLGVLENSIPEDIDRVLEQVQYRRRLRAGVDHMSFEALVQAQLEAHLQSPLGKQKWKQLVAVHTRRMIQEWAQTPEGQQAIEGLKASVLQEAVEADKVFLTLACRDALKRKVDRWLNSPLAQAQLEEEKKRLLNQHVKGTTSASAGWINSQLNGDTTNG